VLVPRSRSDGRHGVFPPRKVRRIASRWTGIPRLILNSGNVPLVRDDTSYHLRPVNSYQADFEEDQDAGPFEEWIKQRDELVNGSAFAATLLLHEASDLLLMAESAAWILYCGPEDDLNDTYGIREAEL
jgi:hypothetical protein